VPSLTPYRFIFPEFDSTQNTNNVTRTNIRLHLIALRRSEFLFETFLRVRSHLFNITAPHDFITFLRLVVWTHVQAKKNYHKIHTHKQEPAKKYFSHFFASRTAERSLLPYADLSALAQDTCVPSCKNAGCAQLFRAACGIVINQCISIKTTRLPLSLIRRGDCAFDGTQIIVRSEPCFNRL
jgi:hypothetical protein